MLRKLRKKRRGQSTVEYAVLIIIIIGALLSMQVYIKRGLQGRLRAAADDIGEQYSPGRTNAYREITSHSWTNETYQQGESWSRLLRDEVTNVVSNAYITDITAEYWGGI